MVMELLMLLGSKSMVMELVTRLMVTALVTRLMVMELVTRLMVMELVTRLMVMVSWVASNMLWTTQLLRCNIQLYRHTIPISIDNGSRCHTAAQYSL